jgi:hypothetical protein
MVKVITLILCLVLLVGCAKNPWSRQEQKQFLTGCLNEGGSKSYCNCYLQNVMDKYPIKEDADHIDFETKIELSKDCK